MPINLVKYIYIGISNNNSISEIAFDFRALVQNTT